MPFLPILLSKGYLHPRNIVFALTPFHSSMFAPCDLVFTAYTSFSASSTDTGCTTKTVMISLVTPFSASADKEPPDPSIVASSLLSYLGSTSCYLSVQPMSNALSPTRGVLSMPLLEKQPVPVTTVFPSSVPSGSALPSQPITRTSNPLPSQPTATTANSSYLQHTQSSSAITGETRSLIIGLVVAAAAVILLMNIGLAYFCIVRKRRRRADEVAKADREKTKPDGEGENPQLYLQQKVELDNDQRLHEMEAAKLTYELQGEDEIYEMPADKGDGRYCRQELNGDECSASVEMSRRSSRSPD